MKHFIKKAETYAKKLKGVTTEVKEKMLIDKFGFILKNETLKNIAKNF